LLGEKEGFLEGHVGGAIIPGRCRADHLDEGVESRVIRPYMVIMNE